MLIVILGETSFFPFFQKGQKGETSFFRFFSKSWGEMIFEKFRAILSRSKKFG